MAHATRLLSYSQKEVGIAIDAGKMSAWAYIIDEQKIHILHGRPMGLIDNGGSVEYIEKVYEKVHPDDLDMVKQE